MEKYSMFVTVVEVSKLQIVNFFCFIYTFKFIYKPVIISHVTMSYNFHLEEKKKV